MLPFFVSFLTDVLIGRCFLSQQFSSTRLNVLPRVLVARAVHYSKLVSLRNRTEEENGKTPVCKKTDRAITCEFCRDLHLPFIFSGLLQKDLSTER